MKKTPLELAIQLTIMDAIEKGHHKRDDLMGYMKTDVYRKSVESYVELIESHAMPISSLSNTNAHLNK